MSGRKGMCEGGRVSGKKGMCEGGREGENREWKRKGM